MRHRVISVVSVILPYYKDEKSQSTGGDSRKEIVYRRHVVGRMPIDAWSDIWWKLHQQLVNVDVYHVDTVPAEVYSSVATAVVWGMRLALAIGVYIWIDNRMRPIYAKLIPCDLGTPPTKTRQPLKRKALGSLGKNSEMQQRHVDLQDGDYSMPHNTLLRKVHYD